MIATYYILLTIFILPNTSRRLLSLPSDHPLGSLTLSANMGARNCSSVVLEKNYYCNLIFTGNIVLACCGPPATRGSRTARRCSGRTTATRRTRTEGGTCHNNIGNNFVKNIMKMLLCSGVLHPTYEVFFILLLQQPNVDEMPGCCGSDENAVGQRVAEKQDEKLR